MKKLISSIMALSIAVMSLTAVTSPVHAAVLHGDEFNSVTAKSGSAYFNWSFGDWSAVQFSQAEFSGEKVLAGTVGAANDLKTYQRIVERDKVIVESELALPAADADRAYMVGIGLVTLDAAGNRNYWDGVKVQQNGYIFLSGANLPSTSKYQSGTLLKVGYAYDQKANTVTYYAITNNKELVNTKTITLSNSNHTAAKLDGVALSLRGYGNYLGTGYWNYLHADTPDAMTMTSITPETGSECVASSKTVKISYNNIIDPNNMGTVSFKKADGTDVDVSVKIYDGRTLVITPNSSLSENTEYTVSVTGTKDLFGSAANASTSFITGDSYHIHYEFDDVTSKSGYYFSKATGTATAMTWSQATFSGEKVLKGTVSAANEAMSWEDLPEMDNVIAEMEAGIPSTDGAFQLGLRPVGYSRDFTAGGIRIARTSYFLTNGSDGVDKENGNFAAKLNNLYRIGFGYDKASKKVMYYVIGNDGQTRVKEYPMAGDYLQGAAIYLRGDSTTASSAYYNYLNIDRDEGLEVCDAAVNLNGIEVTYNNVLNPNVGSVVFKDKSGNETAGSFTTYNGNILKASIPATLKSGATYDVVISGIKDVAGKEAAAVSYEIKVPAIKGYIQDFEGFAGKTYTGGSANVQVGDVLFNTSAATSDIEMVTLDADHGVSAKINVAKTLATTPQIWITRGASDVKKAVVGYSAYMPEPTSDVQLNFYLIDRDKKLSGINYLQKGRVFFNGESRSWYMDETAPRWHDIRLYLDFESNEYHITVDGKYTRSDKIDVTTNIIDSFRFAGAYGEGVVYIDDFVYYDVTDLDPLFGVKDGVATAEFGQEVANVSVSTTEDVTTISERGTNPVSASFEVVEGTVLSVRTLDGVYHRYTYSGGSFAQSNVAAVDYFDEGHRYSGAASLTDTLNVQGKLLNPGAKEGNKTVCVALYDYDTQAVVALKTQEVSFAADETEKTFTISFDKLGLEGSIQEGTKRVSCVKTFALDSLGTIKPIDNAIVWEW